MRRTLVLVGLLLCLGQGSAYGGEQLSELVRTRFGVVPRFVLSPTDGSAWLAEGDTLAHVSATFALLGRSSWIPYPQALAISPADQSCWVEGLEGDLAHFSSDGHLLVHTTGFSPPCSLTASPDGSVWVTGSTLVSHVSAGGNQLKRVDQASFLVLVDPSDGSSWRQEGTDVVREAADGTQLWRKTGFTGPLYASENLADESLWIAETPGRLTHVSASGSILLQMQLPEPVGGNAVTVNPVTGSVWVQFAPSGPVDRYALEYDPSGNVLWTAASTNIEAVNADGSAWLWGASLGLYDVNHQLIHWFPVSDLSIRAWGFSSSDDTLWALLDENHDDQPDCLAQYASDRTILAITDLTQFWNRPWVNPNDGTCWVTSGFTELYPISRPSCTRSPPPARWYPCRPCRSPKARAGAAPIRPTTRGGSWRPRPPTS